MAIFHLSTVPMSRADGRSAVAAAAYRSGSELVDERTGQVFDYTRKGGVLSAEIVTPEGVPVPERSALWNAAEAAERRKDSRIAREWRGALPAELDDEQRRVIAHRWAKEYADRYGVAVDVAIHAPDKDGDDRNFHVHMLATTRKINASGELGEKAAIELANKDREKAGIPGSTQNEIVELRARWAEITNEELEQNGHSQRIDHRSNEARGIDLQPTKHIGVHAVGMDRRGIEAERMAEYEATRRENAEKIEKDPATVFKTITSTQAVFDRRDIARELHRHIDDPEQFQNLLTRLERHDDLVQLAPERTENGRTIPAKYSTREMIETEARMIDAAQEMAGDRSHAGVSSARVEAAADQRPGMSDEQRRALQHVTGEGRLAVVVGDAGTGKSFTMAAARDAWEAEGFRVRGAALAGKAADELQAGSGIESRTLASLEYGWKEGRDQLTSRDVLVIDEAGMVGSGQLGRVLDHANKAGAKVVLLGDDKQLAAIEAGAGFRAITERTGAAEITEIRRQRESWAREASAEFARGDVRTALDAYQERGHVRLMDSRESAQGAIAADYLADRRLGGSAIILAHSNKDVAALNQSIRSSRAEAGELGPSAEFQTARGAREFAQGDRLLFLKNDRGLDVKNGTLGTVQRASNGELAVMLDNGREVNVRAKDYEHVDHGYAVTVHKAQGVTVDRAYLLATPGMDRSLAYVGMTRHRDSAALYAGGDDFASYDKLARNLSRERPKETTLDFAQRHGVEPDGRWSVERPNEAEARAIRDQVMRANPGLADRLQQQTTRTRPGIDLSALDDRSGKPASTQASKDASTEAGKPASTEAAKPTTTKDYQRRQLEALQARAGERGDQRPTTTKELQQAEAQKRLAARKEQQEANAPRVAEAVRLSLADATKAAEKRAGAPLSPEAAKLLEQKMTERLQRDPKAVEQVLARYAKQEQAGAAESAAAPKPKPQEQQAETPAKDTQQRGAAWFESLRQQRDAGLASKTKQHGKDGPER